MLSLLITGSVFLSSCAPTTLPARHEGTGGGHQQSSTQEAKNLTIRDQSTDAEIAFSVHEGNETFMDYGISHTKEMHLILVRNDIQYFSHLHPERDKEGVWHVKYSAPAGGKYWLYADFVDSKKEPFTLRFERRYAGEVGLMGLTKDPTTEKNFDSYRVKLETSVSGNEVSFTYTLTDPEGKHPVLEEYLGAKGHSVLISPSGDFIHTHASEEGEAPVFKTVLPSDPFYRIFTQFQIEGEVLTVNFDWGKKFPAS